MSGSVNSRRLTGLAPRRFVPDQLKAPVPDSREDTLRCASRVEARGYEDIRVDDNPFHSDQTSLLGLGNIAKLATVLEVEPARVAEIPETIRPPQPTINAANQLPHNSRGAVLLSARRTIVPSAARPISGRNPPYVLPWHRTRETRQSGGRPRNVRNA